MCLHFLYLPYLCVSSRFSSPPFFCPAPLSDRDLTVYNSSWSQTCDSPALVVQVLGLWQIWNHHIWLKEAVSFSYFSPVVPVFLIPIFLAPSCPPLCLSHAPPQTSTSSLCSLCWGTKPITFHKLGLSITELYPQSLYFQYLFKISLLEP